jgi:heme/copper-type cytochrome/quinol oxidase subunit 2
MNGILMFLEQVKMLMKFMKFNLIETSVPELISDNIMWWIIIELIIAVEMVIVAIALFIIKIRKALAQPAQPSITYFILIIVQIVVLL